jgi:hypothetical protein
MEARKFFDQSIRAALHFVVGLEAFHPALAGDAPRQPICRISLGLAVNRGEDLPTVLDAFWEPRFFFPGFGRFLCRQRLKFHLPRENWCA